MDLVGKTLSNLMKNKKPCGKQVGKSDAPAGKSRGVIFFGRFGWKNGGKVEATQWCGLTFQ